jgi:hypothetical protein
MDPAAAGTPVAWVTDDTGPGLIVTAGGGGRHPGLVRRLTAHSVLVSIVLFGSDSTLVTSYRLDGGDRERHDSASPPPAPLREAPEHNSPGTPVIDSRR